MRRWSLPVVIVLLLGASGCQEITPPRVKQLSETTLGLGEARAFALQRIRLGDLYLLAGAYDMAYANYWAAHRKFNQDFTPGTPEDEGATFRDTDALITALALPEETALLARNLSHSTVARIALALELQGKYRLLALNLEYFASPDVAQSEGDAGTYLVAAGYYYHQGGLDKYALEPLKKAVVINPSNLSAYANLAVVSETLEETEDALSYWRIVRVIANQLDPTHPVEGEEQLYYLQLAAERIAALEGSPQPAARQ